MKFEYVLDTMLKKVKICKVNFEDTMIYSLIDEDIHDFKFFGVPVGFDLYNCLLGNKPDIISNGKLSKDNLPENLINIMHQTKMGIGIAGTFSFIKRTALESLYYLIGNIKGAAIFKNPSFNRDIFLANLLTDKKLYAVIIQNERPVIVDFLKTSPNSSRQFFIDTNNALSGMNPKDYNIEVKDGIHIKYRFRQINNFMPVIEVSDNISNQLPLTISMYYEYNGIKIAYKEFRDSHNSDGKELIDSMTEEYKYFIEHILSISEDKKVLNVEPVKENYNKIYTELIKTPNLTVKILLDIILETSKKYKDFDMSKELQMLFTNLK